MNKTTICSVVFLDIVEYSKKSVAEQIKLKNQFNALISLAIKNVPITDRIILDTGDGAAISFLGDPEDALLTAMKLREAVLSEQEIPFFLRIGINLGPVRLVQDINKQPNIIGDGINVAQRIMNFAEPNQILVSRSFFDVISCVTDEYAKLFEYQGSRTDKHVREHELYAVKNEIGQEDAFKASFKHTHQVETKPKTPWWSNRNLLLKKVFPAAAVLLILAAIAVKVTREPARQAIPEQPLPVAQDAVPAVVQKPAGTEPGKPAPAEAKPHSKSEARKSEKTAPKKTAPTDNATLVFKVMPWGEIYVDGKMRGISPPLKSLRIKAGRHEIEIRNTTLPKHSKTVETHPGERVIIEHHF
ncbi:MAG: adenylate/guanylate cyclase domain-containing protein [Burkholderiales bacterium]